VKAINMLRKLLSAERIIAMSYFVINVVQSVLIRINAALHAR